MKKLFLLGFIICSVMACSLKESNSRELHFETLPIQSVIIPEEFEYGNTHEITMTYIRPSSCHIFYDFYYVTEENQRIIAIINTVYENADCVNLENEEEEVSFNFQVNSYDSYIFKFWQGEGSNGNDIYHVVEVPVVD